MTFEVIVHLWHSERLIHKKQELNAILLCEEIGYLKAFKFPHLKHIYYASKRIQYKCFKRLNSYHQITKSYM